MFFLRSSEGGVDDAPVHTACLQGCTGARVSRLTNFMNGRTDPNLFCGATVAQICGMLRGSGGPMLAGLNSFFRLRKPVNIDLIWMRSTEALQSELPGQVVLHASAFPNLQCSQNSLTIPNYPKKYGRKPVHYLKERDDVPKNPATLTAVARKNKVHRSSYR